MARAEESPRADPKHLVEEFYIYIDVYHRVFHVGGV
jgi:hypothetical protein